MPEVVLGPAFIFEGVRVGSVATLSPQVHYAMASQCGMRHLSRLQKEVNTTVTRLWCPHLSLYESVSEGIRAPQVHFKFKSNPQILEQVQPCEPQHVQVSLVAMCFSKHWFPEQKEGAAVVTE